MFNSDKFRSIAIKWGNIISDVYHSCRHTMYADPSYTGLAKNLLYKQSWLGPWYKSFSL